MKVTIQREVSPRNGFSLFEMIISVSLMAMLSGMLIESLANLRSSTIFSENKSSLQVMADKALVEMITELRRSGERSNVGKDYPYVFEGGAPAPAFVLHAHAPAGGTSEAGDNDFGLDNEVVFLMPADANADGRPDIDGNGDLDWSADEISYTVVTRADGINYLERRENALNPTIVGHHVERMVIDTSESSGFEIPLESIRIRLFFRRTDSNGYLVRYSNEAVVALRNG